MFYGFSAYGLDTVLRYVKIQPISSVSDSFVLEFLMRTSLFGGLVTCLILIPSARADLVDFSNSSGTLGELIDGTGLGDLPPTFAVPGVTPNLNFTITGIAGSGAGRLANSNSDSFGVDSAGGAMAGDTSDQFDAALSESITFQFDMDIDVTRLNFRTFDAGETFEFAGQTIIFSDLTNQTTDIYDFAAPLRLSAGTEYVMEATAGSIGLEDFSFTAVPEPSALLLMSLLGVGGIFRRNR